MAKGELTILRCRAIADALRQAISIADEVTCDLEANTITIRIGGTTITVRPISIKPVK